MDNRTTENKVYSNLGNQAVLALIQGEGNKILDVGCGAGDNARILTEKGHIVDGITLSVEEASAGSGFMRRIWVHNLEQGLPNDITEKYDYILCSHVLEHIAYPKVLLIDISKQLSPGGKLIVALPNIMHYQSRFKLLTGDFNLDESGIWDYTHLRWYTYRTGAQLLIHNGFQVILSSVDGEIPWLRIFRVVPKRFRQFIYRGLTKISKGLFGSQLIYVAQINGKLESLK